MTKMSEAAKERLRELQAKRKEEARSPGRGTLRGLDPVGWMGSLDALTEGRQEAADARTELERANILVAAPGDWISGPNNLLSVVTETYADLHTRYAAAAHVDGVVPRKLFTARHHGGPRGTGWKDKRIDVSARAGGHRYRAAYVELFGLPADRAADLKRALGGVEVTLPRYRGPAAGVVDVPVTLYPADQIAVLFRLIWFPTAEDKTKAEKGDRLAAWKHFRAACGKYLVCYTPAWCEHVGRIGGRP